MKNILRHWRWFLLLLLYSADAHAWGLYTHVYFAQHLTWAIPLTDPRYFRAVKRFPALVLAGACLPDLALVARRFGLHRLTESHDWQHPHRMLRNADSDAECAIALGYTSHLWVDVIAHNYFVPAHEAMWANIPVMTHAVAEWAMDHHVGVQLYARPAQLLREHEQCLVRYVSRHFTEDPARVRRALTALATAEATLRQAGIPRLCYRAAQALDRGLQRRFNYYLGETSGRLQHLNRIISGETPEWLADPADQQATQRHIAGFSPLKLRHRIPLPQDFFIPAKT